MASAKEFVYVSTREIGTIGDKTIELGHYIVDGKENPDKVYMVSHFTRKNGEDGSKATAICSVAEAKEIGKMLMLV